jgi:hypothetical protein
MSEIFDLIFKYICPYLAQRNDNKYVNFTTLNSGAERRDVTSAW